MWSIDLEKGFKEHGSQLVAKGQKGPNWLNKNWPSDLNGRRNLSCRHGHILAGYLYEYQNLSKEGLIQVDLCQVKGPWNHMWETP